MNCLILIQQLFWKSFDFDNYLSVSLIKTRLIHLSEMLKALALACDKNRKQICVGCTHSNIPAKTGNGIIEVRPYAKIDMSVDYWPSKWSVRNNYLYS